MTNAKSFVLTVVLGGMFPLAGCTQTPSEPGDTSTTATGEAGGTTVAGGGSVASAGGGGGASSTQIPTTAPALPAANGKDAYIDTIQDALALELGATDAATIANVVKEKSQMAAGLSLTAEDAAEFVPDVTSDYTDAIVGSAVASEDKAEAARAVWSGTQTFLTSATDDPTTRQALMLASICAAVVSGSSVPGIVSEMATGGLTAREAFGAPSSEDSYLAYFSAVFDALSDGGKDVGSVGPSVLVGALAGVAQRPGAENISADIASAMRTGVEALGAVLPASVLSSTLATVSDDAGTFVKKIAASREGLTSADVLAAITTGAAVGLGSLDQATLAAEFHDAIVDTAAQVLDQNELDAFTIASAVAMAENPAFADPSAGVCSLTPPAATAAPTTTPPPTTTTPNPALALAAVTNAESGYSYCDYTRPGQTSRRFNPSPANKQILIKPLPPEIELMLDQDLKFQLLGLTCESVRSAAGVQAGETPGVAMTCLNAGRALNLPSPMGDIHHPTAIFYMACSSRCSED